MAFLSTAINNDGMIFEQLYLIYLKRYAKEFHAANKERYDSTSPYAVTTKVPTLRIVDNVLKEGRGHTSPISTSARVVRTGIFKKQAISNMEGGSGSWSLKSKVQFDKVYLCPVTKREFTDADMEKYKQALRQECRNFAESKLGTIDVWHNPSTQAIHVQHGENLVEVFTQPQLEKELCINPK